MQAWDRAEAPTTHRQAAHVHRHPAGPGLDTGCMDHLPFSCRWPGAIGQRGRGEILFCGSAIWAGTERLYFYYRRVFRQNYAALRGAAKNGISARSPSTPDGLDLSAMSESYRGSPSFRPVLHREQSPTGTRWESPLLNITNDTTICGPGPPLRQLRARRCQGGRAGQLDKAAGRHAAAVTGPGSWTCRLLRRLRVPCPALRAAGRPAPFKPAVPPNGAYHSLATHPRVFTATAKLKKLALNL